MGVSFSLILAIGAQNAFVLKQGLKRQFVFVVCLICALSDAILISAGVFGFGKILSQFPQVIELAKYAGALFLFWYGTKSFYSAFTNNQSLVAKGDDVASLKQVVALCVAFTWLNPHVYLDTVILLGTVASQFADKLAFALGAISASFMFFFGLGYGARLLQPLFAKPVSWKILDGIIGVMMWGIALKLLID
ncbi:MULTISPECIES: LysE/ArgO family amino acid transporter [unclassified Moraxella]|uniref:LysE/ArgO family amino acid transporter n=1 Tax=unclassified Moraxella TaxID=2685852 RepID=UPI003AF51B26